MLTATMRHDPHEVVMAFAMAAYVWQHSRREAQDGALRGAGGGSVSYTHLTLPTIYSV